MNLPAEPTRFFNTVWLIVQQIPAGAVATYGQIASMIPAPQGVADEDYERLGPVWVGKAMNAVSSQTDSIIPWQRVINSQGGISLPEGSQAAATQRERLLGEGVRFEKNDRINLNQYEWDGPDTGWLKEQRLFKPRSVKKPKAEPPGQLKLF